MPDTRKKTETFKILVAKDRLKAWLHQPVTAAPGYRPPEAAEILPALEATHVVINDAVRAKVEQFVGLVRAHGESAPAEIPQTFLLAEGTPPVEPENATFEWHEGLAPDAGAQNPDGSIDHFLRNTIRTVAAGSPVGRLKPATEGAPGVDVHGKPIQPARRHGAEIELGDGLRLADDGRAVIAERAGRVVNRLGKLVVEDVLEIRGDVDFNSGSIDACVDVNVSGTIRSNFRVRTTGALHVGKTIEAADVDVGGDIVARGGICGGDVGSGSPGRVRAGGSVTARFCNEAVLHAGGEVRITKETLNSRVRTCDHLTSERGTIIGGYVWAREGLKVGVLGSDAAVTTRVAVGPPPDVLRRAKEMDFEVRERRKSAELIRKKVQPLMTNLKRLSAPQREMATELLSKADELETGADALEAERKKMLAAAQPRGTPSMQVLGRIHPGVRIAFGERETQIDKDLHGPLKIEERKVEGATELVYVNQRTGSVTVLPSSEVDLSAVPVEESRPAGGSDASAAPPNPANPA